MSRHGKSRVGVVTISAKVEKELRDKLDKIKTKLNLKNRSEVVRLAIKSFVFKQ
ncbi:MAG: ribbon-helix-helix protein, CopG family [Thermoplasmata archaeon]|nr:ribbon-helix-helix protein, CopG family [Thermoplasmata archaeon]